MSRPLGSSIASFNIIGWLLALLLTLLLAGCSAVKLGYNNAPEFSYWWLDSYLDFSKTQSLQVRSDLAGLQAWHRQGELLAYVSTLEKLQRMAPANVTSEQLCGAYAEIKPRFQLLMDQVELSVVALAPTFTAEQLDHLARQLDKRSQKWREKWLDGTLAERRARRVKQALDRAELLYGRLDEPQLAVLRASVVASIFDAATNYQESLRRHQDALQTLRQLQSRAQSATSVQTTVHAWFGRSLNSPDAAYRNYVELITQENCRTFATLHNSTSTAQRLKVIETLKDYETDARSLMTQNR